MLNLVSFVVVIVLTLCSAATAEAHERVITLTRGMTVWNILKYQGCSPSQRVALWPLVMEDSGRAKQDPKKLDPGDRITIKRDCDGQLSSSAVSAENKAQTAKREAELKAAQARIATLAKEKSDLEGRLAQAEAAIAVQTKAIGELRTKTASSPFWWQITSGVFLTGFLFVLFDARRSIIKVKKEAREKISELETELKKAAKKFNVPPQVTVDRWGKDVVYTSEVDPKAHKVSWVCPDCGAMMASPDGCEKHDREHHSHLGRPAQAKSA